MSRAMALSRFGGPEVLESGSGVVGLVRSHTHRHVIARTLRPERAGRCRTEKYQGCSNRRTHLHVLFEGD